MELSRDPAFEVMGSTWLCLEAEMLNDCLRESGPSWVDTGIPFRNHGSMAAPKEQRLAEFLARLAKAPPASSAQEALGLVNRVLNEVEDRLSGVPYDPDAARQLVTDGRMYGPHASFASVWTDEKRVT